VARDQLNRRRRAYAILVAAFALITSRPGAADAQGRLSLDVGATHTIPPSGVTGSTATYLTLGASIDAPLGRSVGLFGSLIGGIGPEEDRGNWISGSAGGSFLVWASGQVAFGLTASGRASFVSFPEKSRSALIEAVPEMQVFFGRTAFRLYGIGGFGESAFTVSRPIIRDTRLGPMTVWRDVEFPQDLWTYGGGAEVYHPLGPVSPYLGGSLERSPRGDFASAYAGLSVGVGLALLTTEIRVWDTPFGSELELTAGLQLGSFGSVRGLVAGGRFGPDPLLDVPPATMAAVLVSFDVADIGREPPPLITVPPDGGPVLLQLPVDAHAVTVLGDFTAWQEVGLLEDEGVWSVELTIAPGVYRFGFNVDGEWFVPPEVALGTDEWGRNEAVLVVPET
jgi:Glycogen recognition site of AMP-activated protein kinase